VDLPTFRTSFPEFSDTTAYPDGTVNFWLSVAVARMNASVWGNLYDIGQALYVAHNLDLARLATLAAARGLPPNLASGPLSAKSVKDVAMSFDASVAAIEGAGNYNLTYYGTRFYELMEIVGQGCIQLGGYFGAPGTVLDPYGLIGGAVFGPVF
jgi:hypothetical protein